MKTCQKSWFLAIFSKTTDGICTKMHMNILYSIVFDLALVAESAEIWKYVILHIDLVNMWKKPGYSDGLNES